jgi:hypothetical protein
MIGIARLAAELVRAIVLLRAEPVQRALNRSQIAASRSCVGQIALGTVVASSANQRSQAMPRGDKSSYSGRQKRKAAHIEKGYEKRGVSKKTAQKRAWATVNKQEGGGAKKGGGRKKTSRKKTAAKKGAHKTARKKSSARKSARKRARSR